MESVRNIALRNVSVHCMCSRSLFFFQDENISAMYDRIMFYTLALKIFGEP